MSLLVEGPGLESGSSCFMGFVLKPCGCQQQESSSVPRSTCGKSARHSDFFGCSPFLRIRGKLQLCPASPFRPPGSIDQPNPLRRNSDGRGQPLPNLANVMIALRQDPKLRDLLTYDEMFCVAVLNGKRPVRDTDVTKIQEYRNALACAL